MKSSWSRRIRYVVISLIGATLVGVGEAAQLHMGSNLFGRPIPWSRAFTACMPSWFVFVALLPLVLMVARRVPFETISKPTSIITHLLAGSVFAWTHLMVAGWLSDFVFYHMKMPLTFMANTWRLFATYFTSEVLLYVGIVGVYYAIDYSRRYREKERAASELALKASRLESSLTRANLEALRMQLNPHFLFNTLNTVSVLALKGEKQRVARMLSRLGDLLRLSLENDRQTQSLKEELDFLERYLEIEEVRFKDRLSVDVDVEEAAYEALVPTLILQPLVENAVKYGFSQTIGPGNVSIHCRVKGGMLELEVTDTGPGFPQSRSPSASTGVGIANTRARLEQLYGGNFSLELSNRDVGGAHVRIRMPYVRAAENGANGMMARQA